MDLTNTTVALARILEYESTLLNPAVSLLLTEIGVTPEPGQRVLVKPNLVSKSNATLSCTDPRVVRAICLHLLDAKAKVTVADSPAFGSAASVARACGLDTAISDLGLKVHDLGNSMPLALSDGRTIGVSRLALETDLIVNVPRLKAHCQMRFSGAVKNLFGCVVGFRKAAAHTRFGHSHQHFASMIMDVTLALPRTATLMDAIHPMHVTGPIKGQTFPLGLLAASVNPVALDTAIASLMGLEQDNVPLWAEARKRRLYGSDPGQVSYALESVDHFDAKDMILPDKLDKIDFTPLRLIRGRLKSLWSRLK